MYQAIVKFSCIQNGERVEVIKSKIWLRLFLKLITVVLLIIQVSSVKFN